MGFCAKFQGLSRGLFDYVFDQMTIMYRSSACTDLHSILHFISNLTYITHDTLFSLTNHILPPALHCRNNKCNSTARPNIDAQEIFFRIQFFRGGL